MYFRVVASTLVGQIWLFFVIEGIFYACSLVRVGHLTTLTLHPIYSVFSNAGKDVEKQKAQV